MTELTELQLSAQDYDNAFTEVCFLLDILVNAIGVVAGKQGPSLAFSAGRHMGKKLPIHLVEPKLEDAVRAVMHTLEGGFEMGCSSNVRGVEMAVGRCAVRDACLKRATQPGGDICNMFHHYVAGIVSELCKGREIKPAEPTVGDRCVFQLEVR
jgi:hypothetical protein